MLTNDVFAYVWSGARLALRPVRNPEIPKLDTLLGIDMQKKAVCDNTSRFASRRPANNVLLWGVKGMGKSTLVRSSMLSAAQSSGGVLLAVEILRNDISTLPELYMNLRECQHKFIVFCDDLAFEPGDGGYRSLKAAMDGGIAGRPENVILYATSNHRNVVAEATAHRAGDHSPADALNDKLSLSDRFGLRLGFHEPDQELYLAMVRAHATAHAINLMPDELHKQALQWAMSHASRNGRTACNFIRSLV